MSALLSSGTILINTYKILHVIDQGGMGAIYKAESRLLAGEFYAVKEMLDNFSTPQDKQEGARLFEQEGRILQKLRHPNLPRVQAYFEENGRNYLVMDYIKGRTLESIVESTSDFLPESVVVRWCNALCSILEYLHSQIPPIIFRDLNPRNIMLEDGTGEIKLIDFGIARFFKAGQSSDTLSLGSPGYCPIEQYGRGQTDVRSDVYTLGATLYHLLTKKVPVAAIERIKPTPVLLTPPRKINRRISPRMDQVILRAMEISPDQRFQTVADFKQALFAQETTRITGQPTQPTQPQTARQSAPQPPPKANSSSSSQQQKPAPAAAKTTASAGQTPPAKSRFGRKVWTVVMIVASLFIADWISEWQQRASGEDGSPGGAAALAVPGVGNDRVSFYEGDRTDWWTIAIAGPDTLTVTVTPRIRTDGLRLTLFDQTGQTVLKKADVYPTHIEAVLIVDRPRTVLAQVMAPKIWDAATYTIQAMSGVVDSTLYASLTGGDFLLAATSTGQNHTDPQTAPELRLNTINQGRLQVANGQGITWWRLSAPETGLLTITVTDRTGAEPLGVDCFDGARALINPAQRRADGLSVPVLGGEDYFVKLFGYGRSAPATYELSATMYQDSGVFSGSDRTPFGARMLPLGDAVEDTVSFERGDRIDWWKLVFASGGRVGVDIDARRNESIRMQLYDAAAIRSNPMPGTDRAIEETDGRGTIEVDGRAGETFYLAVVADEQARQTAYRIETRLLTSPDAESGPDGEPGGARTLTVNSSAAGSVDYAGGDRTDWWRLPVSGPGVLTVTLFGRGESPANIRIALHDRTGQEELSAGQSVGKGREELTVDVSRKDTYLIRVFADGDGDAGDYQLLTWYSTGAGDGGDRGGRTGDAATLSLGRAGRGTIDYSAGERNGWWKVRAEGSGTLTVDMEGDAANNLDMGIYESSDRETPLATSRSRNSSRERVSVEVDRAGWYYVEIFAQKPGEKSRYTVTASFER